MLWLSFNRSNRNLRIDFICQTRSFTGYLNIFKVAIESFETYAYEYFDSFQPFLKVSLTKDLGNLILL